MLQVSVANFIKNHRLARHQYHKLDGKVLSLFPETRFSYADLMLADFAANKDALQETADYLNTAGNAKGIKLQPLKQFRNTVLPENFDTTTIFQKVQAIRLISEPLNLMIHHLESGNAKASWVLPLYESLMKDLSNFKASPHVGRCFSEETISNIETAIKERWEGNRSSTNKSLASSI